MFSDQVSFRFRWVFCQLETLRRSVHRNLRGILAKLPKTLDETYERVLRDINEDHREYARRLLHCLAVAIRPLRVEELAEILAFDFEDIQGGIPKFRADWQSKDQEGAVLSTCSSLISVVDSDLLYPIGKCRVVQFSHFSVKEFLMSDRLASSARDVSRYHILPGPAHIILAQACLGFLLHLDTPTDKKTGKRFPLAMYAARHWVEHVQFEDVASRVKEGVQSLLDPDRCHFVAWVGIYDIDHYRDHRGTPNPLYYAACCGFYDVVERLVVSHPQLINTVGGYYDFPVVAALSRKHTRVAELLLRHGGKVDIRGEHSTPMQILIESAFTYETEDLVDSVSFLLQHGTDVNFRGSDLSTPLHSATASTNLEVVQLLLERGADIHSRDDKGKTPLHMVHTDDDELEAQAQEITRQLLERGANVNAQDNDGATPLHALLLAAYEGDYENSRILHMYNLAQILLDHEAKPNVANKDGKTTLHLAFEFEPEGLNCYAVEDAEVFIARLVLFLLEHGADVNVQDKDQRIPLLLAIELRMYDIARILLIRGADPNVKNDGGRTPLHLLLEGHFSRKANIPDLARSLLDRGADVNSQDQNHATPLLLATERRTDDITRVILERGTAGGTDPNVENIRGKAPLPLLLPVERNFNNCDDVDGVPVVERLLQERAADVNAQAEDITTPPHLAYRHRGLETAQTSIDHHANDENDRRTTQPHIASEGKYNFQNIVAMLHNFYQNVPDPRSCRTWTPQPTYIQHATLGSLRWHGRHSTRVLDQMRRTSGARRHCIWCHVVSTTAKAVVLVLYSFYLGAARTSTYKTRVT
jgi:ankyrin repeat protein